MAPAKVVISVGQWDYAQGASSPFTTWAYGHLRKATLELMTKAIKGKRSEAVFPQVATKARTSTRSTVRKKIYATAWDGNPRIRATLHDQFTVTRNN